MKIGSAHVKGLYTVPSNGSSAVRFNAYADRLHINTFPTSFSNYSFCGWFKLNADRNDYSALFAVEGGGGYNEFITEPDGTTLAFYDHSVGTLLTIGSLVVGNWYFIGMTMGASGALTTYFAVEGAGSLSKQTATAATLTPTTMSIGGTEAAGEFLNGSIKGCKLWNSILNDSEMLAEFQSFSPAKTATLSGFWPIASVATRLDDISGNSHPLVDAGLGTWEDETNQVYDGAQKIWDLGLRTFKCYLTADYLTDYPKQTEWGTTPTNLTQLAQSKPILQAIARSWDTVMLTTFTFANGTTNWWRADPNNTKLQNEYDEIYNLVVHLMTTYNGSGKKFILQNWEGDWAFGDSFTVSTDINRKFVDYYAAFLGVRQRAVENARKVTSSDVVVLNCVEVNRVLDAELYSNRRRIVKDIAQRLQPDIVSYSAYDSTIVDQGSWGASQTAWETATRPAYSRAIDIIQRAFPGVPLMIGEFGFPEEEAPPTNNIPQMIQLVHDVSLEKNSKYLIYWQVFDNEVGGGGPGTYRGYWLIKPNGTISDSGSKIQSLA